MKKTQKPVRTQEATGVKYDAGKPRWDLLPMDAIEEIAKVLTWAIERDENPHEPHNWRKGFKWSRLFASCYRHLSSMLLGEDRDQESGLLHAAHLGCCVLFLIWHFLHRPDLDDRWKSNA